MNVVVQRFIGVFQSRKMAFGRFYIFIFFASILIVVAFKTPKMNFRQCLEKDTLITVIIKISLEKCLEECVMRLGCLSLNYRRPYQLCELFSVSSGSFVTTNRTTGPCLHIIRSDILEPQYPTNCQACTSQQTCIPESGTCEINECPKLEIPHGILQGNMMNIGARVKVTCESILYKEDTDRLESIQCQSNGTWDYVPKCTSRYVGCFRDNRARILMSENYIRNNYMTIEQCINHCAGYNYAAPQSFSDCFCGNTLDESLRQPETKCTRPCSGDPSQICGGHWCGSVYILT